MRVVAAVLSVVCLFSGLAAGYDTIYKICSPTSGLCLGTKGVAPDYAWLFMVPPSDSQALTFTLRATGLLTFSFYVTDRPGWFLMPNSKGGRVLISPNVGYCTDACPNGQPFSMSMDFGSWPNAGQTSLPIEQWFQGLMMQGDGGLRLLQGNMAGDGRSADVTYSQASGFNPQSLAFIGVPKPVDDQLVRICSPDGRQCLGVSDGYFGPNSPGAYMRAVPRDQAMTFVAPKDEESTHYGAPARFQLHVHNNPQNTKLLPLAEGWIVTPAAKPDAGDNGLRVAASSSGRLCSGTNQCSSGTTLLWSMTDSGQLKMLTVFQMFGLSFYTQAPLPDFDGWVIECAGRDVGRASPQQMLTNQPWLMQICGNLAIIPQSVDIDTGFDVPAPSSPSSSSRTALIAGVVSAVGVLLLVAVGLTIRAYRKRHTIVTVTPQAANEHTAEHTAEQQTHTDHSTIELEAPTSPQQASTTASDCVSESV